MTVGRSKDAGWMIGVSETVASPVATVWDFMLSQDGLATWLGGDVTLQPEKGAPYETADGTTGEVRGFREHDRVRLTWRPKDRAHESTIQFTVSAKGNKGDKTTLRFHQERLTGPEEREAQRVHWRGVLDTIVHKLGNRD
ncbi:SRPBCC family protein [Amycolatopsis sp. CA-230715]|uniref:SRPBCC family protein n=1 Tax=Amycolatopsis sp. CA-230715 TaxID=2745196 RepID=UPI001C011DA5|nr:SRPBCC domain-containing protein [Amycolatopsis sp. CA-230715]QWF79972.1 hypothetical protein HUW46_03385 [Amycolatopsis sp. CA-230715]